MNSSIVIALPKIDDAKKIRTILNRHGFSVAAVPGACEVKKGEEKGYFEFGGSTIVLLLQYGKVRMDSDLIENSENGYETIVRMGERIGKCKLPKRA